MSWAAVGSAAVNIGGQYLMDKGKGNGEGDTTTTNMPWPGLEPYVTEALRYATDLFNTGAPSPYPESTVTPFSPQTQLAFDMTQNRALNGSPYETQAGNWVNQMMNGRGAGRNPAQQYLKQFANQTVDPRMVRAGPGITGNAQRSLNQTAAGNFLNANPYLDQTYDRAARGLTRQFNESVLPGVNATFSLGGRTGSEVHQNAISNASQDLGTSLGDLSNQIYGGNYQQERDRMLGAGSTLGGYQLQHQGQQLQAGLANQSADMASQQFNQNFGLNMGNLMNSIYQSGVGNQERAANLGLGLADRDWQNIDRVAGVGSQIEQKAGEHIADQQQRWDQAQNAPMDWFKQYVGLLGGIPGSGFQSTNVDQDDGSQAMDWAQKLAMAWAMSSDVALKRDIERVGTVNGFPWYRWTWNEKAAEIGLHGRSEGVLAQEVEQVAPHLVTMRDGYKAVNYAGVLYGTA